jgi:hypothetical protein
MVDCTCASVFKSIESTFCKIFCFKGAYLIYDFFNLGPRAPDPVFPFGRLNSYILELQTDRHANSSNVSISVQ